MENAGANNSSSSSSSHNNSTTESYHSNGSAANHKSNSNSPTSNNSANNSTSNNHDSNKHNASSSSSNNHSSNAGAANNLAVSANSAALLPQLETIERMMKLPVVEAAWNQGQDVYGKVKGYNALFGWALRTAETAVHTAVNTAAPLVQRLDGPIQYVDQTLVTGIEKLEAKAPIIKEQPQEIYAQARSRVVDIVQPQLQKVCSLKTAGQQRAASLKSAGQQRAASLKELSWQKANEVLATQYGSMAVDGLDTTSALAERLLDYYFPKGADGEDDEDEANVANDTNTVAAGVDPVLHTCQTVGRLSNKVARRVYRTVSRQVKLLKKEDVHEYVASLIAVLRLTQYLNYINEKVQSVESTSASSSSINTNNSSSSSSSSNNHTEQPAAAKAE